MNTIGIVIATNEEELVLAKESFPRFEKLLPIDNMPAEPIHGRSVFVVFDYTMPSVDEEPIENGLSGWAMLKEERSGIVSMPKINDKVYLRFSPNDHFRSMPILDDIVPNPADPEQDKTPLQPEELTLLSDKSYQLASGKTHPFIVKSWNKDTGHYSNNTLDADKFVFATYQAEGDSLLPDNLLMVGEGNSFHYAKNKIQLAIASSEEPLAEIEISNENNIKLTAAETVISISPEGVTIESESIKLVGQVSIEGSLEVL